MTKDASYSLLQSLLTAAVQIARGGFIASRQDAFLWLEAGEDHKGAWWDAFDAIWKKCEGNYADTPERIEALLKEVKSQLTEVKQAP